ncbi:hypothetical protein Tco_1523979 [Tanacetum coccineum]
MVQHLEEMGEGLANPTDPHHTPTIIQPSTSQPQKTQKPRRPKRKDTEVPQPSGPTTNVADEAVNEEMDDSLVRAATTASSLESDSGGGPKRQEIMRDIIAQTRYENVSELSNDPLLVRGNTLRNGEDSLKLQELMALCTTLQTRVLDLEITKITQGSEIASLKRRVKKLERRNRSRTHKLKRLYKVGLTARVKSSRDEEDLGEDASKQGRRIHDIDANEDITLVNNDNEMFEVGTLTGDEVLAEQVEKWDVIEEPSVPVSVVSALTKDSAATTTTATILTPRKGIVFQELDFDEKIASKLQAEFDEEVRLTRERAEKEQEANVALTEEWDNIQAKIKANHKLAQRLQAQEQERGKKPKDLKNKSFDSIQKMFHRAFKRVNTFVDFRTDLVEGNSKRAGTELEQEVTKKKIWDDVQGKAEMDFNAASTKVSTAQDLKTAEEFFLSMKVKDRRKDKGLFRDSRLLT